MKHLFYAMLLTTAIAVPVTGASAQTMDSTTSANTGMTTSANTVGTTSMNADGAFVSGTVLDTTTLTDLQRALASRGYNPGRVDGIWGPQTQQALQRFHMENGLTTMENGMLNSNTLSQLGISSTNPSLQTNANVGITGTTGVNTVEPAAGMGVDSSLDSSTMGGTTTGTTATDTSVSGTGSMDMGVSGSSTMDSVTGSGTMDSTTGSSTMDGTTTDTTTGVTGTGTTGTDGTTATGSGSTTGSVGTNP